MPTSLNIEEPASLVAYLRAAGRIAPDETPEVRILEGGVSNRTVFLRRPDGEAWVLKQALERLRVAVEWVSDPRRIQREALGMRHLGELIPGAVPRLIFEDPEHHLLAMEAVPEPHENWKRLLLAGQVSTEHVREFGRMVAGIHGGAWRRRERLATIFADTAWFESLRIEPYYTYAASQVPAAGPFVDRLVADTRARRLALVHGDYSPKNILVHDGRLVLLDHEVIHWGDPGFDLGFALTHLLSKAHHLPGQRAALSQAAVEFWDTYLASLLAEAKDADWLSGLEAAAVRHTLGCLLARVAGRSPLEYLTPAGRDRQRSAVVDLMRAPPSSVRELASAFLSAVEES